MDVTLKQDSERGDVVVLARHPHLEINWDAFLNRTECAVSAVRHVLDTPAVELTKPELRAACQAHDWLIECGVHTLEQFSDLEKHLPLLRQPADAAHTRQCTRCGARIWGREAILTGLGSSCRRTTSHAERAYVAWLRAEAAKRMAVHVPERELALDSNGTHTD